MDFGSFLKAVSKIEQIPLPGFESQLKMSPPFRRELMERYREGIPNSKKAAVIALFYPDGLQVTKLMLILRKTYKGVHSAQVGFPGGRWEDTDATLKHTALRETEEEVGVPVSDIEVLREMTEIYIPPSNFTVHPFFGIAHKTPMFVKQDDEVEDLIEVTVADFMDDSAMNTATVMTSLEKEVSVPAFILNGHVVWGATAMMLIEIKDLLKAML